MKYLIIGLLIFSFFGCGKTESKNFSSKKPGTPRGTPGLELKLDVLPEITDENIQSLTLSGTCIDGRGQVSLSVDSVAIGDPVDCVNGRFSITVDLSDLPEGTTSIKISVSQGTGDQEITDTLPANVSVNEPPPPQPVIPSFMELIEPKTSPSENFNPVIRVKDRQPGDLVELFTDSECKNKVASGSVPEGSTSVDLTVCQPGRVFRRYYKGHWIDSFKLSSFDVSPNSYTRFDVTPNSYLKESRVFCHENKLTPGNYKFYEKSSNSKGSSGCSTEYMEYFLTPDPGSPPPPKALSIESPNPGVLLKPVIRVLGVIPDNVVTLHLDKFCNDSYGYYDIGTGTIIYYPIGKGRVEEGKSYIDIRPNQNLNAPGYSQSLENFIFFAKTANFFGYSRCSKASEIYTLDKPQPPSSLTLVTPSPGTDRTPTIRVSGVQSGNTVSLYRDSQCISLVASGVAQGNSIDLTTFLSSLTSPGTYTFYAKIQNSISSSDCSTASVTYVLQ